MNLDLYFTAYTKINSKWIKDLNIRATTLKPLEENTGVNLCRLGLGTDFLDKTPKAKGIKKKIN